MLVSSIATPEMPDPEEFSAPILDAAARRAFAEHRALVRPEDLALFAVEYRGLTVVTDGIADRLRRDPLDAALPDLFRSATGQ